MKVKVLSLLVPALLATGVADGAEIYNKNGNNLNLFGKVGGLRYISNDVNTNGDQAYIHIGFKGETKINEKLTGYGQLSYQLQGDSFEEISNTWMKIAFAGLRFNNHAGSLDYGRNYGVVYDITSWTNVLPSFGGDTYESDNFMQQHGNSFVTYRNTNFFGLINGLNFAVQYQGKNDNVNKESITNNSSVALKRNGNGIGGSITYDLGDGFEIGAAISNSKRTKFQNNISFGNGNHAETYTGGLKYDINNIYLAAQYTQTYNATRIGDLGWANKAQNVELVAQYQFNFGLRPSLAYLQSKGKSLDQNNGNQNILKYIDVGATYFFNKNMSTYVDYKLNLLDKNDFTSKAGISTNNIIALGLTYQF